MKPTKKPAIFSNERPELYLIYLIFLYLPWFFVRPGTIDIIATIAATLVYIPLHMISFRAEGPRKLVLIAMVILLGVAIAPFANGNSVFHIYAAALSGTVRPIRSSVIMLGLAVVVYVASASYFERHVIEIMVALLISFIVWVTTFSDTETIAAYQQAERERTLEAQQASLVERERIARDLHDLLGHTLTLVSLKADLALRLIETDPDKAKEEIAGIQASSRDALADVRSALSGLTATSVLKEIQNSEAALSAAGVKLFVKGTYPELSAVRDTAVGLMIREAITNVVRHSSATEVSISFDQDDDIFGVTISDNGTSPNISEGNGLSGLRRRLEGLGGMLTINDENGVQVRAKLPI